MSSALVPTIYLISSQPTEPASYVYEILQLVTKGVQCGASWQLRGELITGDTSHEAQQQVLVGVLRNLSTHIVVIDAGCSNELYWGYVGTHRILSSSLSVLIGVLGMEKVVRLELSKCTEPRKDPRCSVVEKAICKDETFLEDAEVVYTA